MKKIKNRQLNKIFSMVCNLAIILFAMIGFVLCYYRWGWRLLTFYTEFSNFFALITSSIVYVSQLKNFKEDKPMTLWVKKVKYFSTCCLSLTFLVVLFILAPGSGAGGFRSMFLEGPSLYFHLLNPIVAIISFVFFEREPDLSKKTPQFALIPTILYGFIIYPLIITEKILPPYPFLAVYNQPIILSLIWFLILLAACYLVNFGLYLISTNDLSQIKRHR